MRKIKATVEGTISVPILVKREIEIEIEDDAGCTDEEAISLTAQEMETEGISVVSRTDFEAQYSFEEIDDSLTVVDPANLRVDNIRREES